MSQRMERLLKLRKTGECIEAGRWARARLEAEALRTQGAELAATREAADADLRSRVVGRIDPARLALATENRDALSRSLETSASAARDAEVKAEAIHRDFEAAARACKALEKISERQAAAQRARVRSAEVREADDRGVSR